MTNQSESREMLRRPEFHLDRLPLKFRWEVTRRHPVYLQLWEIWRIIHNSSEGLQWDEVRRNPVFLNAASAIQVFGEPIDPAVGFADLPEDYTSDLFFRDALQPVSVKAITGVLIRMMSSEGLRALAQTLDHCANDKDGQIHPQQILDNFADFLHTQDPELNAVLDAPFYSVSPVAPREQLMTDLAAAQAAWRTRLQLPTSRDRSNDYPNYLSAWDKCEGYRDGEYRRHEVNSFSAIAVELKKPEATIRNWYGCAFKLISGHDISPENWFALMGTQQLSAEFGAFFNPVSRRRVRRSPATAEPDFSTVARGGGSVEPNVSRSNASQSGSQDTEKVAYSLCEMIEAGLADDQILAEIELGDKALLEAIPYLRARGDIRASILQSAEK